MVSDYNYLDVLNGVLGKVYHSTEDAKKDLANLFRFLRISMAAIEKSGAKWYPALRILRNVSINGTSQMTAEERAADVAILAQYGQNAMDCLKDAKPVLAEILEARNIECTQDELSSVYSGLKDMTCDSTLSQFEKELNTQLSRISQARNRLLLKERWRSLSGEETVKDWCKTHGVPLLWILDRKQQKAISTVIDVQNGTRTLDQDVLSANSVLSAMDISILSDDKKIAAAFVATVGEEYKPVIEEDRVSVMAQAKMKIGNDMSLWDISDLAVLQKILKRALQEKAKKEKLSQAKSRTANMSLDELRMRVNKFMENHPEFCDDFLS